MHNTVAAIVVTYNRKEWLVECLQALRVQSQPVARIYIIDNASTDGTADLLDVYGFMTDAQCEYIRMEKNTGGAGGFHAGLSRAFTAGYEWFWLMDDDVEPFQDALGKLLSYQDRSGCIHGRRRNVDGTPVLWGYHFDPHTVTTTQICDLLFECNQEVQVVNVGCFEGMLIRRDVVAQIGFPKADLFICGDDTYYGYLASHVTPVLYVNVFSLRRKRSVETRESRLLRREIYKVGSLTQYYFQRNRFLIARSIGSHSFSFARASLVTLVKTMLWELMFFGSPKGALAALRGFIDGVKYFATNPACDRSSCGR
jgi:GT2 family glycosyltransferase